MDKVLAFSILSASPADVAAGVGGRWTRLSWRGGTDDQGQAQTQRQQQRDREEKPGSPPRRHGSGKASLPRFAPEFDGIDCFETIVSH